MDHDFSIVSKMSSLYPGSFRFSAMWPFRNFIPLHFPFKYDSFWADFCGRYTACVQVHFFFPCDIQLFKHRMLKKLSLLYCIAFATLSKISRLYLWGSIHPHLSFTPLKNFTWERTNLTPMSPTLSPRSNREHEFLWLAGNFWKKYFKKQFRAFLWYSRFSACLHPLTSCNLNCFSST